VSASFVQTARRGLSYRERDRARRLILATGGKQRGRVLYSHSEAQAIMKAFLVSQDMVFNYFFTVIAYLAIIMSGFFAALSLLR
jgi:hypothetical protein